MSHRVVYFLVHGEWPDTVDHINGNRKDNRIENLRAATKRQNLRNLTKARGFYFAKQQGKFVAQICN
ncbi:HNH endonuclease signature motif containing protein, partial [Klebsiella pneumoniae]